MALLTVVVAAGAVEGGLVDDAGGVPVPEEQAAARVRAAARVMRPPVVRLMPLVRVVRKPGLVMVVPPWADGVLRLHRWHVWGAGAVRPGFPWASPGRRLLGLDEGERRPDADMDAVAQFDGEGLVRGDRCGVVVEDRAVHGLHVHD